MVNKNKRETGERRRKDQAEVCICHRVVTTMEAYPEVVGIVTGNKKRVACDRDLPVFLDVDEEEIGMRMTNLACEVYWTLSTLENRLVWRLHREGLEKGRINSKGFCFKQIKKYLEIFIVQTSSSHLVIMLNVVHCYKL